MRSALNHEHGLPISPLCRHRFQRQLDSPADHAHHARTGWPMRGRVLPIVGIVALAMTADCATGTGFAADLPQARPLPMIHSLTDIGAPPEKSTPPDGVITLRPPDAPLLAREPRPRAFTRLDAALVRFTDGIRWYWFLPVLAF
jgi:hypothetical protein